MKVKRECLPKSLPIMNPGCKVEEMEVLEVGKLLRDGTEYEYAVVKILMI